ncbi:MAG: hypothetical protein OSB65_02810 [Roseibacillus sp.]|nr:hypothetical protein [Roseibacillus sp.]
MEKETEKRGKLKKSGKAEFILEQEFTLPEDRKTQDWGLTEEDPPGRRFSLKYVIPIVILVLLGITVPLALRLSSRWERSAAASTLKEGTPLPEREQEVNIDEAIVSDLSALEVAQAFLGAGSERERLALVRDPERALAKLAGFAQEVRAFPIEHGAVIAMGAASASGNMRFERFAVTMADGRMRLLCIAATPRGPMVDYESFARYGTATWQGLLEGEAGEEVRLVVKPSFYFNHGFTNDKSWTAFELSSPDWPDSLTGYATTGSPTAELLTEITSKNRKQRVTLKLRPEGESHHARQVRIEKVLASGWVLTEGDIEKKWQRKQEEEGPPIAD